MNGITLNLYIIKNLCATCYIYVITSNLTEKYLQCIGLQTCNIINFKELFYSINNKFVVMLGNYFQQTTSADNIFRYFFLGALMVNPHSVNYKDSIHILFSGSNIP